MPPLTVNVQETDHGYRITIPGMMIEGGDANHSKLQQGRRKAIEVLQAAIDELEGERRATDQ